MQEASVRLPESYMNISHEQMNKEVEINGKTDGMKINKKVPLQHLTPKNKQCTYSRPMQLGDHFQKLL
jgi:hypothetical protein